MKAVFINVWYLLLTIILLIIIWRIIKLVVNYPTAKAIGLFLAS